MPNTKEINLKTFTYAGVDHGGNSVHGECRAKTKKAATIQLEKSGIKIKKIAIKSTSFFKNKSIKEKDIVNFTRYLATMIHSGIPIIQSLDVCIKAASNQNLSDMLVKIKAAVESGHSISEALNLYPKYFNSFYRNLLRIGESSGTLDTMLLRIADYLENMQHLKDKFKKALLYPAVIIFVSIAVTSILLIYVVPQFESMFKNLNAELPWFTQLVLDISRWLQAFWFRLLTGIVIIGYFLNKFFKKSETAKMLIDGILLNIPIFGNLIRKICIARFARTLTTMLSAGIPLLNCLPAAAKLVGNNVYKKAITSISRQVESGQSLNVAIQNTDCFNNMMVQMISIGESSGALDEMLLKISELYETEVDNTISNLSNILEPVVILIVSVIVGSLIIAMYLPIFSLGSVL